MKTVVTSRRLAFVACCLLTLSGVYLIGGYWMSPCQDRLSFSGYDVEMNVTYDGQTGSLTVTHHSGITVPAHRTESLSVVVLQYDESTGGHTETARYRLANSTEEFPIAPGRRFHLSNVTIDNQPLTSGDRLLAVLRTTERPLPRYCRHNRSDAVGEYAVGRTIV